MHILFLTDNFPPEVNAPASRTYEHCREWVRAGHRVTVITCAPNFPKGKVFPGYRNRLRQTEQMDGITVIRVWSYITANEGFVRRTLDYMSFMAAAVLAAPSVRKPDIVIGTSPQFFTACAGWMVGAMRRIPFVMEVRDLWPESIRTVGAMENGRLFTMLERIETFLYRRAALIVSVTNSFKAHFASRGIDMDKVAVVTNGVDSARFTPRPKDAALEAELGLKGKFVAGYIGTHGMAHALETILEAGAILRDQPGGDDFRLLLLGDGANKAALKAEAEKRRLENVIFLDTVPKDEVARYWSLLDVSIIHLRKSELFKSVIPSKLFECMGMAIPVLHGVEGESAEIVEREEVGLTFEPENAWALSEALMQLRDRPETLDRLKENGPKGARRYDRAVLARTMLEHLEHTAAAHGRGAADNARGG